jgi:hypothetical protein
MNEEIESKIGDLQQAVSWLGDQVVSIQHQLMLSCDWNVTMYRVIPTKYNASWYSWEQIKYHLQDLRGNITLDVEELKRDIFNTFKNKLPGISYEGLAKGIADPRSWLQSIMHSLLGARINFIVCLVIFCIGCSCLQWQSYKTSGATVTLGLLHLKNKKGGNLLKLAVGPCLCDLASGLVRKLQGTEAKVSGPDDQKNNSAQGSPDGFVSFRCK